MYVSSGSVGNRRQKLVTKTEIFQRITELPDERNTGDSLEDSEWICYYHGYGDNNSVNGVDDTFFITSNGWFAASWVCRDCLGKFTKRLNAKWQYVSLKEYIRWLVGQL